MPMTINEALAAADGLRPNPLSDMEKANWLLGFERRLLRELGEEYPNMSYPKSGGEQLSAQGGFEEIYVLYLCAKIDFALREYDGWNNTVLMLNSLIEDYKKQHLRDRLPDAAAAKGVWRREV